MKEYKQKVFYNSKSVVPLIDEFKRDVVENSYNILLEQKYKNDVSYREPTDKSLEWILEHVTDEHNICITHKFKNFDFEKETFEVVFFYDWYFAWCDMDVSKEKYFIDKYNLKKLR